MKKCIIFCIILFVYVNSFSQKAWVEVTTDKIEYKETHKLKNLNESDFPIFLMKGEIFESWKVGTKDYIIFGWDTLISPKDIKHIDTIEEAKFNELVESMKSMIQKNTRNNLNIIDISKCRNLRLGDDDTIVFFYGKSVNDKIQFKDKTTVNTDKSLTYLTRIVVPGLPSVFFDITNIPKFAPKPEFQVDTLKNGTLVAISNNRPYRNLPDEFDGDIYKHIPKNSTTIQEKTLKLKGDTFLKNKRWVKKERKWKKKEGINFLNILSLIGALLILFFLYKFIRKSLKDKIDRKQAIKQDSRETKIFESETNKNTTAELNKFDEKIQSYFKSQKNFIQGEIKSLMSGLIATIEKVQEENAEKNKLISNLTEKSKQIEIEKQSTEKQLDEINSKFNGLHKLYSDSEAENKVFHSLIKKTPYLKPLGYNYSTLLEHLATINNNIDELSRNKIQSMTIKETDTLFKIKSLYAIPFEYGVWSDMFKKLKDGYLIDAHLIKTTENLKSEDEVIKYLRKYIFNNFWGKYLNMVLLFLESIRNISLFSGESTDFSTLIENKSAQHIEDILLKVNELADIDVNYVKLLSNYEDYGFTKVSSETPNILFSSLQTKSENILQILSFGFKKNHNFEDEKTWVIIK